MEHVKCLIIGSGVAGYTAAIYASRANLKPVLYTGVEVGGQLMQTTEVENFPGYPNGTTGYKLMDDLKIQAENLGTEIRFGYVSKVQFSTNVTSPHHVLVDDTTEILADAVIISTGASAKWLGLESEARLNGYGVSACAVCDGFFYKNLEVAVVGGGDTACEEALYLANLCPKVHLLVRSNKMRASQVMQARVEANPNIQIHWHTQTLEILGDTQVTAMRVLNTQTNETSDIPIQGFFVAIGHKPNTDIFKGQIDLNPEGYIVTKAGSTYTNVAGVFACGDAQDSIYRQAVTAAGTGCMAALDAERWLSHEEFVKSQA